MPDATERSYREGARTVRTATWTAGHGPEGLADAHRVLEHVTGQRWATHTAASQPDDGPVTVVVEVAERDRWYADRRIQMVGQWLARACGSAYLVSVVSPAPHTNRQPSVDARQAQRAARRAALLAARGEAAQQRRRAQVQETGDDGQAGDGELAPGVG